MDTSVLPTLTDGTPHYDFSVDLEGRTFTFEFRWNDREGAWYFDLYDSDGNALVASRKVVLSMPLLSRFREIALPSGVLMAIDTSGKDIDPGLVDLGDRVQLIYIPTTDLPADAIAS